MQLFICFWQAAKFIIKSAAEARRMFGGERERASVGFIRSACVRRPKLQTRAAAAAVGVLAAIVLRNLKSAVTCRTLTPKKHILQAALFVLDDVASARRRAYFPRVLGAGCVQINKSAAC